MTKVLVVTASFGDGHNQAARAIQEAVERLGAVAEVADYTKWLHPVVRTITKFSLMQGVQKVPALYGVFYRSMARMNPDSPLQHRLYRLGMREFKACLRAVRPDVVVSTFPTPGGVLSELRSARFTDVPSTVVLTDYTFNAQYVTKNTDHYFVPCDDVKADFVAYGVPEARISVTGIPIRSQFTGERMAKLLASRDERRVAMGLSPDKPLVILMGGGAGVLGDPGEWESVIGASSAQFVVICGTNERLRRRFEPLASNRVRVLGYTQDIETWMSMADLLVSKAGGISVTEALAAGLPMLIYRPIPGQEVANAAFAVRTGAAKLVSSIGEAARFLDHVYEQRHVLEGMRAAARRQDVGRASAQIAKKVLELAKASRAVSVQRQAKS
ncbi:glycosyltransferase [Alicyclobacillus cycloheptanicus]|uniref:Processive 1,2-diacylglycerol beta-glucosyltransferase n=1 Tax=Alicyclobacillus cycloheptanicus TaxID=1457 RepID=A0ABT9XMQ8_9BACL|nr:glycosyltransferase [Alicyclobacillus cycloheptanicus]MDQ0191013.1 processive 1,2-diacylglycerol beta-glucosyltransferase [Alicyclobacillus cycloheptanicus]WDM00905.1 glycosyltransferase [Alicyclobacillus cycloheptanicus]